MTEWTEETPTFDYEPREERSFRDDHRPSHFGDDDDGPEEVPFHVPRD